MDKIKSLNKRYIRVRGEDKLKDFMISIIMMKEIIRTGIDQTAEIKEYHLVVGYIINEITEIDQGMNRIIGMTLGQEALEVICEQIRI